MPNRSCLCLAVGVFLSAMPAQAGVAVIANHTESQQTIRVSDEAGRASDITVEPRACRPLFSASPLHATLATPLGRRTTKLVDGAAYRIADGSIPGVARLARIGFDESPDNATRWRESSDEPVGAERWVIPVVLYVDEDERTREAVWKDRLRERIERASEVFAAHSGVRLRVAGFGRWDSDDRVRDFVQSFLEFRREADPPAGHVAIGFSSQYVVERGRRRLGGTRGMLRRHLMIREWSPQVTENDRLQLLLHELGHHFGAAHSPEPDSLMRPMLGDRQSRLRSKVLRYDVASTLVMALVGDEVRTRGVTDPNQLSAHTRGRLAQIYSAMRVAFPDDPAAGVQAGRIGKQLGPSPASGATVLKAVTAAAAGNRKRPLGNDGEAGKRLSGDDLASELIRVAARTAADNGVDPQDFLLSLGLAFDHTGALGIHPRVSERVASLDTPEAAARRANVLGKPTARGREDTLKHFTVMAALVSEISAAEASALGFAKEAIDAQGGTGFSFADIAANRAGIRFAERVMRGATPPTWIAENFTINDFVPDLDGLPEALQSNAMIEQYGGRGDERFEAVIAEIDRRLDALPPYRPLMLDIGPLGSRLRKSVED